MTETETTGDDGERSASRGAGFPILDLATAVETIHKVGEHGGEFSSSAFAQYLGHSTANSGPFRAKAASFREWGLARSRGGRVFLTDLGKEVAKSADPRADEALLRRAFFSCKIFKTFYDDSAKGVPLKRDPLARSAVFDHKVAAKSQEKFVAMLVDSAVTVGLAEADGDTVTFKSAAVQEVETPDVREQDRDLGQETPAPVAPAASQGQGGAEPARQPAPPSDPASPVLLRQVWPTATGEVVLAVHSTDPLPASAFALVGVAVQAAEDLAKSIGEPRGDGVA